MTTVRPLTLHREIRLSSTSWTWSREKGTKRRVGPYVMCYDECGKSDEMQMVGEEQEGDYLSGRERFSLMSRNEEFFNGAKIVSMGKNRVFMTFVSKTNLQLSRKYLEILQTLGFVSH